MLMPRDVESSNRKSRRLRVAHEDYARATQAQREQMEDKYAKYGSVDAGFFWFSGRQFGCVVALILLLLPIVLLFYGIYAMQTSEPIYELSWLPLAWLRNLTAIAIVLFTPLLPFRLWLLISAIENEKAIDRIIAMEEGTRNSKGPSWRNLAPNKDKIVYHQKSDSIENTGENTVPYMKLVHMLVQKKNHPNVLSYGDIQDVQDHLINKDWWHIAKLPNREGQEETQESNAATQENNVKDNYLVMVALYGEDSAMERLTRGLARLKYSEPEKYVRFLVLLEESEHGPKQKKEGYDYKSKQMIADYEKKRKDYSRKKGLFSSNDLPQRIIDSIVWTLRTLVRLIGYIFSPLVTYRWSTNKISKSEYFFGDPKKYKPKRIGQDDDTLVTISETTYQAAMRSLIQLPDPTIDLGEREYQDTRRSFAIGFVPNTERLGNTHRKEAQTKPRALNYGIYQSFDLHRSSPDEVHTPSVTRNRAIRLQPFVLDDNGGNTDTIEELEDLIEDFENLIYQATCYHHVVLAKKPKENSSDKRAWHDVFKDYQKGYCCFRKSVLDIFLNALSAEQPTLYDNERQFKQAINKIVKIKLDPIFKSNGFRDVEHYGKVKTALLRAIHRYEDRVLEANRFYNSVKKQFEVYVWDSSIPVEQLREFINQYVENQDDKENIEHRIKTFKKAIVEKFGGHDELDSTFYLDQTSATEDDERRALISDLKKIVADEDLLFPIAHSKVRSDLRAYSIDKQSPDGEKLGIELELKKHDATFKRFQETVKSILERPLSIKAVDPDKLYVHTANNDCISSLDKYFGFGETPPSIFIEKKITEQRYQEVAAEFHNSGYLGGYLLRMMTGYHDRYHDKSSIDVEDLALLCLSRNMLKSWNAVRDVLEAHLEQLEALKGAESEESSSEKPKKEQPCIEPLLLPAFFHMDYRYSGQGNVDTGQSVNVLFKDEWQPRYCAVYDAEDRPEEDQLLKSVYTYKFYEYLPMLLAHLIRESLCVRVRTIQRTFDQDSARLSSAPNNEWHDKAENIRNKARELEEKILEVRDLDANRPDASASNEARKDYEKNLAALKEEFSTSLDALIDDARALHFEIRRWELDQDDKFEAAYDRLFKREETDTEDENQSIRDYFWWRAGLYLYDFLENKPRNEWDRYLDKGYPKRRANATDPESEMRDYNHQIVCLQAKLTYENLNDNWLIALFKSDYATWFNYLLPGLHVHNLPIPLGGTSNHFDMQFLDKIGGWDAFNVAEDCDLGMWIARDGKRVAIVESITWEVASPKAGAWVKQRSRWNKGYMQSYFVHMRNPVALWRDLGAGGFISFQMTVGAGFLLPMLSASFYVMTLIYIISLVLITVSALISQYIPTPLFFINDVHFYWTLPFGTGSLFISNAIFFLILIIGHLRHPKPGSIRFIVMWWWLYWIFTVVASLRALYEFLFDPFHWELSNRDYL